MAGDQEGDRVPSDSRAYCPDRGRRSNRRGDVLISRHGSHGDLQQRPPDLHLEVRAAHQQAEWDEAFGIAHFEGGEDPRRDRRRYARSFLDRRVWPARGEVAQRGLPAPLVKREGADAAVGRGDECFPERGIVESGRHAKSAAALAELTRRHRIERDEQVVQAAAAREPGVVGGVNQVARLAELFLCVFERQDLREPLRADPGPAREEPLEVERAHADMFRDLVQAGTDRRRIVEKADRAFDPVVVGAVAVGAGSHRKHSASWDERSTVVPERSQPESCDWRGIFDAGSGTPSRIPAQILGPQKP